MSSLVLLGSLGTAVSTLSMLPHLAHALRTRRPAGSAFAWAFGAFSSGIWFIYGFAIGDVLVAAPGFVTIPVGLTLAVWCLMAARHSPTTPADAAVAATGPTSAGTTSAVSSAARSSDLFLPAWWDEHAAHGRAGDTLEMPRIAA